MPIFTGKALVRAAWGGRGSGKTRSFALMAALKGYQFGMQGISGTILCARQFQNSLAESSLEEIKRAIEAHDFLKSYYKVGEASIKSNDGREAIDSSVHKVISEFGGLDVLVNVAGICYSGDPETIDAQECAETFDVNIKGMFYITVATLPYLKKEIRADIINISSIWGVEYNPSLISYSSSKFAVEGYTGGLRLWGMPQNIRVCSIQVDKVNTDFRRNFKGFPEIPPENLTKMLHPDDIASAVNFILSSSNTAQISSIRLDAPLWYQV